MFEQMTTSCAEEGSFGRLDNELIAKGLFASLLEAFGRCNAAKVRAICAVAMAIFSFMQRASELQKERACGESVAKDPGIWILKRGNG